MPLGTMLPLAQARPSLSDVPVLLQVDYLPPGTLPFTLVTFSALLVLFLVCPRLAALARQSRRWSGPPAWAAPFLRSLPARLLWNVVAVMAFFAVWEACVAAFVAAHPQVMKNPLYEPHPLLVFRLRPGVSGDIHGVDVKANSMGLRERELPLAKPPGEFRIVCLGESNTFGYCVPAEDAWPRRLEDFLQKRQGRKTIRVINCAVPGYTIMQGYMMLREVGLLYHPDLVVVGRLHDFRAMDWKNEHYDLLSISMAVSPGIFPVQVALSRFHVYNVLRDEVRKARLAWAGPGATDDESERARAAQQQGRIRGFFEERLMLECSRSGVPLVLTQSLQPWVKTPPGARVACVPVPIDAMLQEPDKYCFPHDRMHLNPVGNDIVAHMVEQFLVENHFVE